MAITLTTEQISKLRAGASMADLGLNEDGTPMSADEIAAHKAAKDKGQADAEIATVKAELETVKGQLTAAQAELTTTKAGLAAANVKVGDLEKVAAHHEGLVAIARDATARMLIPMGGTQAAVDGMDAAALIAEHARVKPLFLEKFPAGRVSEPSEDDQKKKPDQAEVPFGFEMAVKTVPQAGIRS